MRFECGKVFVVFTDSLPLFVVCALQDYVGYTKLSRDSRFFAADEAFRSRGLSARTSSPRRSNASALSGSALRIAFSRYAISSKAGRNAPNRRGKVA